MVEIRRIADGVAYRRECSLEPLKTSVLNGCGRSVPRAREERVEGRTEVRSRLDVRHVPAIVQHDAGRAQGGRSGLGGRERDGIVIAVHDDGIHVEFAERGGAVEVLAEGVPDFPLRAAGEAERRQLTDTRRISWK
ncbi:MAG: hypothetical protein IPO52_14245 [Gemmatimonadetes bacterium]|nr:hypothetical protein [Gemmatimonadota bacterium]